MILERRCRFVVGSLHFVRIASELGRSHALVNQTFSNLNDEIAANPGAYAGAIRGSKSGDLQPDEKFAKRSYLRIMTPAPAISDAPTDRTGRPLMETSPIATQEST
jgi:hypothetical protein